MISISIMITSAMRLINGGAEIPVGRAFSNEFSDEFG